MVSLELQYLFLTSYVVEALQRWQAPQTGDKEVLDQAVDFFDLAIRDCVKGGLLLTWPPGNIEGGYKTHQYALAALERQFDLEEVPEEVIKKALTEHGHIFYFENYRLLLKDIADGDIADGRFGWTNKYRAHVVITFFACLREELQIQTAEPTDSRS